MKVKGQKRKEGKTYLAGNTLTFGCMAEFRIVKGWFLKVIYAPLLPHPHSFCKYYNTSNLARILLISAARSSPPRPSKAGVALAEQSTENSILPLEKNVSLSGN